VPNISRLADRLRQAGGTVATPNLERGHRDTVNVDCINVERGHRGLVNVDAVNV
jgi:hypothetical protein